MQQQTSALKQTSETESYPASADTFTSAGLVPDTSLDTPGFGAGLQAPFDSTMPGSNVLHEHAGRSRQESGREWCPAPTPADNCDPDPSGLFCVYDGSGRRHALDHRRHCSASTSTEDVLNYELLVNSNKPDIVSADDPLQPGQKIRVPLYNGTIHTVLSAETLTDIADEYGVTVDAILSVPGNGISDPDAIGIGTEILVPNPQRFAPIFRP